MSIYNEVNEAIWRARHKHSNRGPSLIILMGYDAYSDYMQHRPPHEGCPMAVGEVPPIQGHRVIQADIVGYMICHGV
jgi:hypothetical protein